MAARNHSFGFFANDCNNRTALFCCRRESRLQAWYGALPAAVPPAFALSTLLRARACLEVRSCSSRGSAYRVRLGVGDRIRRVCLLSRHSGESRRHTRLGAQSHRAAWRPMPHGAERADADQCSMAAMRVMLLAVTNHVTQTSPACRFGGASAIDLSCQLHPDVRPSALVSAPAVHRCTGRAGTGYGVADSLARIGTRCFGFLCRIVCRVHVLSRRARIDEARSTLVDAVLSDAFTRWCTRGGIDRDRCATGAARVLRGKHCARAAGVSAFAALARSMAVFRTAVYRTAFFSIRGARNIPMCASWSETSRSGFVHAIETIGSHRSMLQAGS